MQRTAALLLAIAALAGCRSSQQPVNPFIRTTVPPPGTGEAAVVVPGDPYYPGATPTPSPQLVTPTTPPPAATAVPVVPAPPPVPAQPTQPPTRDLKRAVPGGNLFYHQSSTSPQLRRDAHGLANDATSVNAADPDAIALGGKSDAVKQALALSEEPEAIVAANFEDYGGRLPGEPPPQRSTREPSARPSTPTEFHYSSKQKVRVVGDPETDDTKEYEVDESALEYDSSCLALSPTSSTLA
jgi:hypothetical protein